MLTLGEEFLFQIGGLSGETLGEVYLKFWGNDKKGIRMSGNIPKYWAKINEYVRGPELFQNNYIYQIVDLDFNKNKVWLKEVGINLNHNPASAS
jgi:hypothetical protein